MDCSAWCQVVLSSGACKAENIMLTNAIDHQKNKITVVQVDALLRRVNTREALTLLMICSPPPHTHCAETPCLRLTSAPHVSVQASGQIFSEIFGPVS